MQGQWHLSMFSEDEPFSSPLEQAAQTADMTIDGGQTPRRAVTEIKSSSEARRVINELLTRRKKSNKQNVADETTHQGPRPRRGAETRGSSGGVEIVAEPSATSGDHARRAHRGGVGNPRASLGASSIRHMASRLLGDGPRRSKSETNLDQALPELDASQKCTSMTQLVTLTPHPGAPLNTAAPLTHDPHYLLPPGAGQEVPLKAAAKSPGFYSRKFQSQLQYRQQQQQKQQRQVSQEKLSPARRLAEARLKSRSEGCLLQMGKRRKPPSASTNFANLSPATDRRNPLREPTEYVVAVDISGYEPPRAKTGRELSFDLTPAGYDARYDMQIEIPQLTDVEKEIEEEFRKKSVDKCRRWMNRWMPAD